MKLSFVKDPFEFWNLFKFLNYFSYFNTLIFDSTNPLQLFLN